MCPCAHTHTISLTCFWPRGWGTLILMSTSSAHSRLNHLQENEQTRHPPHPHAKLTPLKHHTHHDSANTGGRVGFALPHGGMTSTRHVPPDVTTTYAHKVSEKTSGFLREMHAGPLAMLMLLILRISLCPCPCLQCSLSLSFPLPFPRACGT